MRLLFHCIAYPASPCIVEKRGCLKVGTHINLKSYQLPSFSECCAWRFTAYAPVPSNYSNEKTARNLFRNNYDSTPEH